MTDSDICNKTSISIFVGKMQQVPELPAWVPTDLPSCISAARYIYSKGLDKAHILQTSVLNKIKQFSQDFEVVEWLSVEGLLYITILLVIITSILTISVNVYRKIRYAIPARVNCWFCNVNTKVLYSLKDTWTCPNCHQYNGFTADGHYNKRIPAQFIEALNRPVRGGPAKGYQFQQGRSESNGLCSQCNLNQVLKVFQLASFVPVNERNYDAEIEAEQKRLEQLYNICDQCKIVVDKALKQPPEARKAELMTVKNHQKVNKVIPTPTTPSENVKKYKLSKYDSELSLLHDGCLKDVSDSSDNSGDSFLSLDNLKIGSKRKNNQFEDFHQPFPSSSMSPRSMSPSSQYPSSPSLGYNRHASMYGSSMQMQFNQDTTPIWKDYPLVQGRLSPTAYSVIDAMSCPPGRPAYSNYNAAPSNSQFSYQSSNIGGVFGGRKPLISPPKFSNSTPLLQPYIRYGPYYDVTASPPPVIGHNSHRPIMFSPHCFANPISRSSSQSSGFVSQHGSPQPPVQTSTASAFAPGT